MNREYKQFRALFYISWVSFFWLGYLYGNKDFYLFGLIWSIFVMLFGIWRISE